MKADFYRLRILLCSRQPRLVAALTLVLNCSFFSIGCWFQIWRNGFWTFLTKVDNFNDLAGNRAFLLYPAYLIFVPDAADNLRARHAGFFAAIRSLVYWCQDNFSCLLGANHVITRPKYAYRYAVIVLNNACANHRSEWSPSGRRQPSWSINSAQHIHL